MDRIEAFDPGQFEQNDGGPPPPPRRLGFFAARWRGTAPLDTLLYRDMLLTGTAINVITGFFALMLFAADAPAALAAFLFFLPLPYNVFLFVAVWRTAERAKPWARTAARALALAWLAVSIVL